jgi:tRNA (guanine37-N1)-methyltransferase
MPYVMDQILDVVLSKVKAGGIIHFYTFKKRHEIETQTNKYVDKGLEVICCRKCGNVAPEVCRWAFDLRKSISF